MIGRPDTRRRPGIALILALVVVMLLTAYLSEFFFSTGLELRSMTTFKDAAKARGMGRLAFKATQAGLMLDELTFFSNYRNMQQVLKHSAIPWQDGLLLELKVIPQDGLFNLNELDARPNTPRERVRWNLYSNILKDVEVESDLPALPPQPIDESGLADMYAALVDWIDSNDVSYQGAALSLGAEQAEYLSAEPELTVKNGPFDRLSEIRLVRGILDSRLPWNEWEGRFSVLPKSKKSELYPEKLNVNVATREEIQEFLEQRQMENTSAIGSDKNLQDNINQYADNAEAIAEQLAPENPLAPREALDKTTLDQIVRSLGLHVPTGQLLFSFANQYYRVRIITSFNDVDATLEAVLKITRDAGRIGISAQVLHISLN